MLTHGKIDVTKSKLIFLRLNQVPIELINMAKLPKSKVTSRLFSYKPVCGKALVFYLWAAATVLTPFSLLESLVDFNDGVILAGELSPVTSELGLDSGVKLCPFLSVGVVLGGVSAWLISFSDALV